MGIKFEMALEKAKKRNSKYNKCIEYKNAWVFDVDDGVKSVGGADDDIVILKEDGKMLMPYEYYLSDIGESEAISIFSV